MHNINVRVLEYMDYIDVKNKISHGEVVKLPTDTVYGYICDAKNQAAIEKIYELKNRDKKKPIGIFVKDLDIFYDVIEGGKNSLDKKIIDILEKNWPGAFTVVCKKRKDILDNLNDGLDTIGIRIPKNDFLLKLLSDFPYLAQTSANISGEISISSNKIGQNDTKESTIIDITTGKIKLVRQGDVIIDD